MKLIKINLRYESLEMYSLFSDGESSAIYKRYIGGLIYIRVSEVFTGVDCWFKAIDLYHLKNNY